MLSWILVVSFFGGGLAALVVFLLIARSEVKRSEKVVEEHKRALEEMRKRTEAEIRASIR